jgi:protein TonB
MTAAVPLDISGGAWLAPRVREFLRDSSPDLRMRHRIVAAAAVTLAHIAVATALLHRPTDNAWKVPVAVTVSLVSSPLQEHVAPAARKSAPTSKPAMEKTRTDKPLPAPDPIATEAAPVAAESPAPAEPPAPVTDAEPYVEPLYDAAYLKNDPPAYPLSARRRGAQGTVVVRAEIGADGRCGQALLKTSSGHAMLDEVALAAVRGWRFVPAKRGVKPLAAWVEIPIVFKLTGRS